MEIPAGKRIITSLGGEGPLKKLIEEAKKQNIDGYMKLIYESSDSQFEGKIVFKNASPTAAELEKPSKVLKGREALNEIAYLSSDEENVLELYSYSHSTSNFYIDQIISKFEDCEITDNIDIDLILELGSSKKEAQDEESDYEIEKDRLKDEYEARESYEEKTVRELIEEDGINLQDLERGGVEMEGDAEEDINELLKRLLRKEKDLEKKENRLKRLEKELEEWEEKHEKKRPEMRNLEKRREEIEKERNLLEKKKEEIEKREREIEEREKKTKKREENLDQIKKSIGKKEKKLKSGLAEKEKKRESLEEIREKIEEEKEAVQEEK
ncbi:MAG: hypothetical protein ACOCSJ_00305, partial [Candidatus Natronoplasma sp.]